MSRVLVIAEHVAGELREVTHECVAAAQELGGPVTLAVIASDPDALAGAANREGVDEIVTVAVDAAEFSADVYASAVEALVNDRRPAAVLCGFTVNGMGFAPAVAARLGLGFASDVIAVRNEDGAIVAERELYGAKVRVELDFPDRECVVLMVRPTTWAPVEQTGSAEVTALAAPAGPSRTRHVELVEAERGDVDITTADFLLSIGRGVGEKDSIELFERLAENMGATLSASRPLVDAGWIPAARQVGQSGKTVKPKVYLAFGISGAVQHLAGMKTSGTIIAVNSDPEAAIFGIAHYGTTCDLFEVAEELEKLY